MTTLSPGARIWRGAKGFDVGGGTPTSGTPNVPKYGSTSEQEPSIPGGPVSPDEWSTYGDISNIPEAQGIQAGYQKGGMAPGARIWHGAKGFDKGGSTGVEKPSGEGDLVLYHGTTRQYLDQIKDEGLKSPDSVNGRNWPMLTTSQEQAQSYINDRSDGIVLEYHVPAEKVWARGRSDALLWPLVEHNVYEQQADAYALRQPVPPEYLSSVIEVGTPSAASDLNLANVAEPSDLRMIRLATEANWQARNFDESKDEMRSAAREAQLGYEGLQLTPREIEDLDIGLPPKGQSLASIMGREIVSRAAHSDPTEESLYRGVMYDQAMIDELTTGRTISLPLSSFTDQKSEADRFASGEAWRSRDVPDDGKGIVFELESGAKVAEVSGEQVGFGQFEITGRKGNVVTLKHVSMQEIPTKDSMIKEALKGINERGGITIDLKTGHQPTEGYGFAPSKDTELMFKQGVITPEDVDAYIDSHFEALQGEGMHFGAWVSEEDKSVYLDVSKVGKADLETIRAAMKAEQLGIWDFGAPMELGEVRIGSIDDATKIYTPAGDPGEIHAQHQREVQAFREKASAAKTSDVPTDSEVDKILDSLGPEPEIPEMPSAPEDLKFNFDAEGHEATFTFEGDLNPASVLRWFPSGEIKYIYTDPKYQGKGLATELITRAHDQYPELTASEDLTEAGRKFADKAFGYKPERLDSTGDYSDIEGAVDNWEVPQQVKEFIASQETDDQMLARMKREWQEKFGESSKSQSPDPTPLEESPEKPEPGPRVWKDGKSFKLAKDGPGKGGPGSARQAEKPSVPELLGKAGKVLGPTLTAANDIFMAYGLVDQAAQQGIQNQVAKGNVVKKGPNVLGIPTGTAFSDPAFKNGQSFTNRSPADLDYWLKHGKWPEQDKPQTRSGPTLPDNPGMQRGGQTGSLKLRNNFRIRHADGSITHHTMSQVGPQGYRADGKIKLAPGDKIELDTHH